MTNFQEKQNRLLKALDVVTNQLASFKDFVEKDGNISELPISEQLKFQNWNNYHDLEYRLRGRLSDNYIQFNSWHFEAYGWCSF